MNETLWDDVVADLAADHRCVVPVLPLGGHRRPVPAADLTDPGLAAMIGEFVDRLGVDDVTLVGNDTGGALAQLLVAQRPELVARLVLASCDAFDNWPPGLPGRVSALAGRLPGGPLLAAHSMRVPPLTRLPVTWGWMAKRPIRGELLRSWFGPLRADRAVRADAARFLRSLDKRDLLGASAALAGFDRPALLAWAAEDKVMPPEHAHRLAAILPDARVTEIADSHTLLPLDQPRRLAAVVREFVANDR